MASVAFGAQIERRDYAAEVKALLTRHGCGRVSGATPLAPFITGKTAALSPAEEYRSRWGARASKPLESPKIQHGFGQNLRTKST